MRTLLIPALFAASTLLSVQQPVASAPPAGSNWQHVQALPTGANIHVKAQHGSATCRLKSVDADSLSCAGSKNIVFQRAEIRSITIPRRGRSALIGLAVGAGAGAGIGAATGKTNSFGGKPIAAAVYGLLGGLGGTTIGYFTDFAHSTIYKAP